VSRLADGGCVNSSRPTGRISRRGLAVRVAVCAAAAVAFFGTAGCRQFGSLLYMLQPRQWVEPEFKFEGGKLAVLVEPARADGDNPVFTYALHQRLRQVFQQQNVDVQITPFDQMQTLKQMNPNFSEWSVQRVGREANVNYVLYLSVRQLMLAEDDSSPLITPAVEISAKLIGVDEPDDAAVLWPGGPREREGRVFRYQRDPVERTGQDAMDREARKLGSDVADRVARYFYRYDAEEKPARAR
jgi:hypothetical protein